MRCRCLVLCLALVAIARAPSAAAASALQTIAPEVVKGLGALPASPIVVASSLATDQPAPKGDELAVRVAHLIAGKIGGTARAYGKAETLASARAASAKAGALVYVQTEIAKGDLRVTADLYPSMSNAWDRIRIPTPAPRAHVFVSAPLDAEVRTFLPPVVLERATLHKSRHDEGEVLAVGCGDLDGDGGMEVALATRARVVLGHVSGGKLSLVKTAPWNLLLPRASVPLREPLAGIVFRAPGALLVGTTERGGVQLDSNLAPVASLTGIPVPLGKDGACARASAESQSFEGDVTACAIPAQGARPSSLASASVPTFDVFAHADIVQKDGTIRPVWASREPSGKLRLRYGDQVASVDAAGAQLALGDLDLDGDPEILTTSDAGEDFVLVSSWTAQGLRQRAKIPAPAGVRALCVCPPEERGIPALVAVVGDQIWIWR